MALSQLRSSYAEFQSRNAALVEVGPTPPAAARRAFHRCLGNRDLEFPYLCDPAWSVHRQYGLHSVSPAAVPELRVRAAAALAATPPYDVPDAELRRITTTFLEHGLFIIDEGGTVQYAHVSTPASPLPTVAVLLEVLDG